MMPAVSRDSFDLLVASLKQDEGLRLKVYKCPANKWTIGYGRNLEDNGISQAEAHVLLEADAIEALRGAASLITAWDKLGSVRQNVVANMVFQLGRGGVAKFSNFLAALEKQDYSAAAKEMRDSLWAKQTPERAERLAKEMSTGKAA